MINSTSIPGNVTSTVGWPTINLPKNLVGSGTSSAIGGSLSGTSTSTGTVLMSGANGVSAWSSGVVSVNSDMTDFCEMVLSALGHDITYDDFCKMSKQERKSLLRDIKIKRLLD